MLRRPAPPTIYPRRTRMMSSFETELWDVEARCFRVARVRLRTQFCETRRSYRLPIT